MEKSIVFFLSGLAILLAGCSKVETTEEPTAESPRHLIVDIDVNYSGESRSVKAGWEAGDVITSLRRMKAQKLPIRCIT